MEEGWERPPRLELEQEELMGLIVRAFPGCRLAEYAILPSGLANTNIRFRLLHSERSYVLRLYTRDPSAALREREIMTFLAKSRASIPVPELIFSDPSPEGGFPPYSVWEFVEGELLQDLFGKLPPHELVEIAHTAGQALAALRVHRFDQCGVFGEGLRVITDYGPPSEFVPGFIRSALFGGRAGLRLGHEFSAELWNAVERAAPRLSALDGVYTLVHGDYKRSNLILRWSGARWQIAATLDWEFAFAGPPLIDVGLFLRAGGRLPDGFRAAFAAGYREAGGELPEDWLPLSRLVDLLSQLTFLNGAEERPRVFAETTEVVRETLRMLRVR